MASVPPFPRGTVSPLARLSWRGKLSVEVDGAPSAEGVTVNHPPHVCPVTVRLPVTAMAAADVLGLDLTVSVGDRLRDVLPRVAAATIELVIGILLAMMLGAVTRRVFETARVRGSRVRGQIVTVVLSAFAVLLALEQLGLAAAFIMALGITAMAAVGLAGALAFGLGCRDLARDFIVEYLRSSGDDLPRRPS